MLYENNSNSDKTVVMPLGGNAASSQTSPPFTAVASTSNQYKTPLGDLYVAQQTSIQQYKIGTNPLIDSSAALFMEIVALRNGSQEDLEHLRERLESLIKAFEVSALASITDRSQVLAARYVLCTAIDESVSTSPLGESGQWARHALLSTFHNETWGGEKFFQVLDRCMQQPAQSLFLLELMYILISLGFEGKYRVMERGTIALESLRDKIYRQIRILRGDPLLDLSNDTSKKTPANRIYRYIPLWAVTLLSALFLLVTFIGFFYTLNAKSDVVFNKYYPGYGKSESLLHKYLPAVDKALKRDKQPEKVTETDNAIDN